MEGEISDGVKKINKRMEKISVSSQIGESTNISNEARTRAARRAVDMAEKGKETAVNEPLDTSRTDTHQLTGKDILNLPIVVPVGDAPKFVTSGKDKNVAFGNVSIVIPASESSALTSAFCQKEAESVKTQEWRETLVELPLLSSIGDTSKYKTCSVGSAYEFPSGSCKSPKGNRIKTICHNELNDKAQGKQKSFLPVNITETSKTVVIDLTQNTQKCDEREDGAKFEESHEGKCPKPSSDSANKITVAQKKSSKILKKKSMDDMKTKADEPTLGVKPTDSQQLPKDSFGGKKAKNYSQPIADVSGTFPISECGKQKKRKNISQHLSEATPLQETISETKQNDCTSISFGASHMIPTVLHQLQNNNSAENNCPEKIINAGLEEASGHISEARNERVIDQHISVLPKAGTSQASMQSAYQQANPKSAEPGPSKTLTKSKKLSQVDSASGCMKKGIKNIMKTGAIPKNLRLSNDSKFLEGFNPEQSRRETRKYKLMGERIEKLMKNRKKRLFDENGLVLATGEDLCDCLIKDCPGCYFPCTRCGSNKCGHVCRRNRTWMYDEYEIEGTGIVIKRQP